MMVLTFCIIVAFIMCVVIFYDKSTQEKLEKLEKLKTEKKEKNDNFKPTTIIEINTTSTDTSMDFLVNEIKEKFAISYFDASDTTEMQEIMKIVKSDIDKNEKLKLINQVKSEYSVEKLCKFIEYKFDDLIDYDFRREEKFVEVILHLNDINCPFFHFEFFDFNKTDKEKYEERLKNAEELCSALSYIKNNTQKNETEYSLEQEQLEKPVINTKVYSFIFNVIGIRGDERLDVFDAIEDDTEISIDIDGFNHKILIETENGVFGLLGKKDTETCFQAIAEITGNDILTIFAWTVKYDCQLVFIDKNNNKCRIKIEFWHEDFDRDNEELEQENIEVEKSCEEYDNKKTLEDDFNWDLWHSLYNDCSRINFVLAGSSYKNEDGIDRKSIINELPTYFPVSFVKEPNNPFDKNAIAVYSINGKIGYVPKNSIADINRILNKIKCMRAKKNNQYVVIDVLFM